MQVTPSVSYVRRWCPLTCGIAGIYQHKRRWRARVSVRGRWVHLGLFTVRQSAERVADAAATLPLDSRLQIAAEPDVRRRLRLVVQFTRMRCAPEIR